MGKLGYWEIVDSLAVYFTPFFHSLEERKVNSNKLAFTSLIQRITV